MKFSIAVFAAALTTLPAQAAHEQGVVVTGAERTRTVPVREVVGPQIFINDTNTAIFLATPTGNVVEAGRLAPGVETTDAAEVTRPDGGGIGIGLQGSDTAMGPQTGGPAIAPQENQPTAIGQQGDVAPTILPGLSDQGIILPAPNTIVVGPPPLNGTVLQLQPALQPQATRALGQPTTILGEPTTVLGQPTTVLGEPATGIGQQGMGTVIVPSGTALDPNRPATVPRVVPERTRPTTAPAQQPLRVPAVRGSAGGAGTGSR